ncbi:VOC family protein [Hyunsoonleella flava]|uniref:VOC family protein n=1 Tax=Hyunsoonleella flava TaxID=2527939 RepID=A0A4V2J9Z4_9FLAO|nr:VOC family protein [Hyunsoonleella flava]TBN02663.1 VOC family protein [Hyunsoonleella flava]
MDQRLTIVTLGVKDLKKATLFYEDSFGWEKMPSSNNDISFFQLNGILLSFYPREKLAEDAQVPHEGNGFKGVTLAYNTRSKEEVDKLFSELERKGVTILKAPEDVFWGGYSGYVSDLDKNLWEIAFNPFLQMDEKGSAVKES